MADDFAADGQLAKAIPGFKPREPQRQMAHAVADAIDSAKPLVVEAGTGTGKTYAYLAPALRAKKKVIISTGSKALQDQLYSRDLPTVAKALKYKGRLALLKGRSNYLCLERLEQQPVPLRIRCKAHLRGLAPYGGEQRRFAGPIKAGDGNQLRLHAEREDARIRVAARARDGASAERRVHVDVPVGDHFGARVHHGEHHEVAAARVRLLARAHRLVDHERAGRCWRGRSNRACPR